MMNHMHIHRTIARFASLALLFMITAIAVTTGQERMRDTDTDIPDALTEKLAAEVGQYALDYWTPKLNDYKTRIDRMLTGSDLEKLNRLRVRWGILVSEMLERREQMTEGNYEDGDHISFEIDDDDANKFNEVMTIFMQTSQLAQSYRTSLNGVQETVLDDFSGFATEAGTIANEFVTEHQAEFGEKTQREIAAQRTEMNEMLENINSDDFREDFSGVYSFALEPIIMLYNGGDLRDILSGVASSVPTTEPIAGLLPSSTVLQQNVPNPASSTTAISYRLPESSSRTILRIYSADGSLVKEYDEGAQATGTHTLDVDVSGFAAGSYLYHLTVATSGGDMVFSKVMQVIR